MGAWGHGGRGLGDRGLRTKTYSMDSEWDWGSGGEKGERFNTINETTLEGLELGDMGG